MPHLLLKYICHSVFGIYSIVIQYEKFMKLVPAYGKHCSTTYTCQLATPSLRECDLCYVPSGCSPRPQYSSVTKDNAQTVQW